MLGLSGVALSEWLFQSVSPKKQLKHKISVVFLNALFPPDCPAHAASRYGQPRHVKSESFGRPTANLERGEQDLDQRLQLRVLHAGGQLLHAALEHR